MRTGTLGFVLSCPNSPSFARMVFWRDFSGRFPVLLPNTRNVFQPSSWERWQRKAEHLEHSVCTRAGHFTPPPRLPLLIYFRNRLAIPFCDTHHHCQVQSRHKSVQIRCSHYGREISSLDARVRSGSLAFPSIPFTKLILSSSETCVSQTVERQAQSAGPLGVRS